jgi:hypothetical protein
MRFVRAAVAVLLVAAAGAALSATASGAPAPGVVKLFRTPSGNIGCVYATQGKQSSVRCDIRSGLKPKPARPKACDLDYGDSYELANRGRTILVCHGDTALDPHAPVLGYGKTWHGVGLVCTSKTTGLRCTNTAGHGFFMSRARSYRF